MTGRKGMTWKMLASMSSGKIRDEDLFPAGFVPLPFPNHPEGGMLFAIFPTEEKKDLVAFLQVP